MDDAKLEGVWIDGGEIRIDFDNDFHCAIQTNENDSPKTLAVKLISMGQEIQKRVALANKPSTGN